MYFLLCRPSVQIIGPLLGLFFMDYRNPFIRETGPSAMTSVANILSQFVCLLTILLVFLAGRRFCHYVVRFIFSLWLLHIYITNLFFFCIEIMKEFFMFYFNTLWFCFSPCKSLLYSRFILVYVVK